MTDHMDAQGWRLWWLDPPPSDEPVEYRREGVDGSKIVIPKMLPSWWNAFGVRWRSLPPPPEAPHE